MKKKTKQNKAKRLIMYKGNLSAVDCALEVGGYTAAQQVVPHSCHLRQRLLIEEILDKACFIAVRVKVSAKHENS